MPTTNFDTRNGYTIYNGKLIDNEILNAIIENANKFETLLSYRDRKQGEYYGRIVNLRIQEIGGIITYT